MTELTCGLGVTGRDGCRERLGSNSDVNNLLTNGDSSSDGNKLALLDIAILENSVGF